MKLLRKSILIVIIICSILVLSIGTLIAYAATDSATNTKGVRSSQISVGSTEDSVLLQDDNGTTPEQAVLTLVEAENAGDWERVYKDLSAYTAWNYEFVRADLAYRAPQYSDFQVLQTDFIQLDNRKYARVQVSYTLEYREGTSDTRKTLSRAGDWRTVFTEDGIWKVEYDKGTPGSTLNVDTPPDPDVVIDFVAQPSIHSILKTASVWPTLHPQCSSMRWETACLLLPQGC